MIKTVDDFLMNLAKKMILISAFFGISRKTLAVSYAILCPFCWMTVESLVRSPEFFISKNGPNIPHLIFSVILSSILAVILWFHVKVIYREDDILSPYFRNHGYRLFWVIFMLFLGEKNVRFSHPLWPILIMLNCIIPTWLDYILLNQSPQNPLRLQNLLKNALGKIKQAFTPAPQPQPQPSPTA